MDDFSMLENQDRPSPSPVSPVDLYGLSPEEIRGVSASRANRRQNLIQMTNLLLDYHKTKSEHKKREAEIASIRALEKRRQAETRKLEAPVKMVTLKDDEGKDYSIPEEDIVNGMKLINQVNRNRKLNLLTDKQIAEVDTKMPITVDGQEYQVSQAHYKAISEAGRMRKQEERKTVASKALVGVSPRDMLKAENFNNLLTASPNAAAALLNKLEPENLEGLSDAQYREYAKLNVNVISNVLKKRNPDATLINTANNLSRKLRDPHMLMIVPDTSWSATYVPYAKASRAVTVELPPGTTADKVFADAERLGVDVSVILQEIYKGQQ